MKTERYTRQELETIKKFLEDAASYEKLSKKHWLKEAVKKEDETTFMHLASQSQARLEAVINYCQYVDSSIEFIDKHEYDTSIIFVK